MKCELISKGGRTLFSCSVIVTDRKITEKFVFQLLHYNSLVVWRKNKSRDLCVEHLAKRVSEIIFRGFAGLVIQQ